MKALRYLGLLQIRLTQDNYAVVHTEKHMKLIKTKYILCSNFMGASLYK